MTIRFQADADLNQNILTGVLRREPEIDFQTATTAGLSGLTDRQVLEIAAQAERILVSHDQRTMPRYFAEFISNRTSPGLIIVPKKLSISQVIETLIIVWSASNTEEWVNRIIYLPL
ncbi:DUF5615 family PIN-like protein [Floridanema aerugineum]|uniref:DUF5615 family PIN-like protein n=1 Tax=Floridaenema aerugineum BLCC-F46 TaxID=3153654 RepID=A0ABV4XGB9_9CYAN